MIFLSTAGDVLLLRKNSSLTVGSGSFDATVELPTIPTSTLGGALDRVQTLSYCIEVETYNCETAVGAAFAAAWSTSSGRLYTTYDGGINFRELVLSSSIMPAGSTLSSVVWLPTFRRLVLLVNSGSTDIVLLYENGLSRGDVYNAADHTNGSWTHGHNFTSGRVSRLIQVGSKSSEVFAYGDALWYSSDGGLSFHAMTMKPALISGESIVDWSSNSNGQVSLLTSRTRVFITTASLSEAIEIQSGEVPGQSVSLQLRDTELDILLWGSPSG